MEYPILQFISIPLIYLKIGKNDDILLVNFHLMKYNVGAILRFINKIQILWRFLQKLKLYFNKE